MRGETPEYSVASRVVLWARVSQLFPGTGGGGGRFHDSNSSLEAEVSEGSGQDAVTEAKLCGCEGLSPDAGVEKRSGVDESASPVEFSEDATVVSIAESCGSGGLGGPGSIRSSTRMCWKRERCFGQLFTMCSLEPQR